jgi:hypothetical protein
MQQLVFQIDILILCLCFKEISWKSFYSFISGLFQISTTWYDDVSKDSCEKQGKYI